MTGLSAKRRYFLPFAFLGSLALLVLSGCAEPSTKVSGKVTYQSKPLNSGTITFFCKDNKVVRSCQIGTDGSYAIDKVPLGNAKISISVPPPRTKPTGEVAKMAPSGGPEPPEPVEIPQNYSDPEKSGLTYEVKSGSQPHDIDLK
jgi:hypothetical protein